MKTIVYIIIIVTVLVLLQFLEPYINIVTASMFISLWLMSFNLDAIYTYMNRNYIKQYERNIIMRNLYGKIPYPVIAIIIFMLEAVTIYGLTYLYYEPKIHNQILPDDRPTILGLPITNLSLTTIVFAFMHMHAVYNSMQLIDRLSKNDKDRDK